MYHDEEFGAYPSLKLANNLEFPVKLAEPAGNAVVQVQRTIRKDSYKNGKASIGGLEFPIVEGEASIYEQVQKNIIKYNKIKSTNTQFVQQKIQFTLKINILRMNIC